MGPDFSGARRDLCGVRGQTPCEVARCIGVVMGIVESTSYRYWAFISYSSKDKSWARWLHRAIETYGIPARLVGHPTPSRDPAPKRFQPLFHDRSELPASADVGTEIEDALRASRYLIVVCSPHAAESKWVNKEVETFRGFGRSGRLLAVIVNGEPNAGDERECFPPALRAVEPIAADARREGDGKSDAKLKLLAGMLGVSFDALKQRATHRRIRRLQATVAIVSILALGFSGLATYAQYQRSLAVKARQQAEAMLEYLLFDLRDKLRPIGRLDIVSDAQERIDAYYREIEGEEDDLRTIRNRAVAGVNKGDRLLEQGDLAGALREHRAALESMERLASSNPSNVVYERDVSLSHLKVADILRALDDRAGAQAHYRSALAIDEKLAASDPSKVLWQADLATAHNRLGVVLRSMGNLAGALREQRVALAIGERLAASDPSNVIWQQGVAAARSGIADVLALQGDQVGAFRESRAALAILEHLASSNPSDSRLQRDVAAGHGQLSLAMGLQGDYAEALQEARVAVAIAQRLVQSDPSNATWRQEMSQYQGYVDLALQLQAQRDAPK